MPANCTQITKDVPASVSVIIAAHNASAFIARAVRSALAEPDAADVIVVDDASNDETLAQARTADDGSGRLKLIALPRNVGPSVARNRALQESRAPWISILDADDYFLPGRLKGLLHFSENADFIADDIWRVDESNVNGIKRSLFAPSLSTSRFISLKEFVISNITHRQNQRGELGFIKPLMRRSFLETHNIVYKEQMRLGEDYELYAHALALGAKLLLVPAQGYISVSRCDSLSAKHSEDDLRHLRDCNNVLTSIPCLNLEEKRALRRHYLSIDCRLQWRLLISAVKQRNLHKALATFFRPFPIPIFLLYRLSEQLIIRISKKPASS